MAMTRNRAVLVSFIAGIVVPCAIEFGGRCLDSLGVHPPLLWSAVFIYIWPTGLWLIGTSEDVRSYVAFALSIIANGLLYALIALVVASLVELFRTKNVDE